MVRMAVSSKELVRRSYQPTERAELLRISRSSDFRDAQERIRDVKRSFGTACRRARIEDFRFHDLRHTCAAWLVSAGVPLTEVRDLLGHSSVKVTERYAHLAPENVRAAVAVLDAGESRSGHVAVSAIRVGEL